jgi:S-adenosylmethionine synthetase
MQNTMQKMILSSESVGRGHPDKIADTISDTVLDFVKNNLPSHTNITPRVACEVCIKNGRVLVSGEWNYPYTDFENSLTDCIKAAVPEAIQSVEYFLHKQSKEIAHQVDGNGSTPDNLETQDYLDVGAGDQGIMFGYACLDTPSLMPLGIELCHSILYSAEQARLAGMLSWSQPDCKCQVGIVYEHHIPVGIDYILVSMQHMMGYDMIEAKHDMANIIKSLPLFQTYGQNFDWKYFFFNTNGSFVVGGSTGDCGITGRKIVVDQYGGSAPVGGGAFSGKDATKIDRSVAYYCRWVCKNLVHHCGLRNATLQVAYAIGDKKPKSIVLWANFLEDSPYTYADLEKVVTQHIDWSVKNIIARLGFYDPQFQYAQTTNYGHFGSLKSQYMWESIVPNISDLFVK